MFGLAEDIRPLLARLARTAEAAVLATLVQARGGSPRGLGAQMLLGSGEVSGYLSGGCIEADIAHQARAVLESGRARRIVYGQGGAVDLKLPCGGRIEVLLERLDTGGEAVRRLLLAYEVRLPCLWITDGQQQTCLLPGEAAPAGLEPAVRLAADSLCGEAGELVFRRFDPRHRLVVAGADPPALAMARLGVECGLETTLLRANGPVAPPPIQGLGYLRGPIAGELGRLGLDPWTCVIAATHTAEIDDQVLCLALSSTAAYVGVLGSTRKIEERNARLRDLEVEQTALDRLRAPIGFALGGKSPWTIGLATIAQLVGELNLAEARQGWVQPPPVGRRDIEAVVLAAGAARRFGGGKLLAPLGDGIVLDGALKAAFALGGRVHLVVAPQDEALIAAARRTARGLGQEGDLSIVRAYDHAEGLAGSLRAGVRAASTADAIMLYLGDMPFVSQISARHL
ncbi:MAG: xanthine dehydrogenase, partial [Caulobacteraceae bacterium]|nr:xanthine dehydrogenase [Caulobacteraceae bacterium]